MSATNDGGPAFPQPPHKGILGDWLCGVGGMSLRDYFAAHALTGIVGDPQRNLEPSKVAPDAYLYADAMLAARTQGAQ